MAGEEASSIPFPSEDQILEQEVSELNEMIETYDTLRPYTPNRAQRRAMSKNARRKQKRNLSG